MSGLADLDTSYVDTPTAKSGEGWHPLDPATHLTLTRDDILLTTLERARGPAETDPPYVRGLERGPELQSPDFVGPTHLVRPTLEANRRAQPEYMAWLLENGEGTQCTETPPDALGEDVEMTDACKIH